MTCGSATEALLDLARGVAMPASRRMAVERHVKECAACAADLGRHRNLTAALRALSTEARTWSASPEIERRLHAALDAGRASDATISAPAAPVGRWVYALAVAAIVALAAWIGSRASRPPAAPATAAAPSPATPLPTGSPALTPALAAVPPVERPAVRTPRRSRPMPTPVAPVRSVEFIAVPSAVGLPDLESGSVVRIQVPVGALPEYGVDIVPNVLTTTVEADVLVGQDGQLRAIRLVTAEEQSTRDARSKP